MEEKKIKELQNEMEYCSEFIEQLSEFRKQLRMNSNEISENTAEELFYAIYGNRLVKPDNSLGSNKIIIGTGENGSMREFLRTLLTAGAIKYVENEDPLIFYDFEAKKKYTIQNLKNLQKQNSVEHEKLVKKLQLVANVIPTEKYSSYVNCGNFLNSQGQRGQIINQVTYLDAKCKEIGINPAKLLMGNKGLSSLDTIYKSKNMKNEEKKIFDAMAKGNLKSASSEGNTIFSCVPITEETIRNMRDAVTSIWFYKQKNDKPEVKGYEKNNSAMPSNDEINILGRKLQINSKRKFDEDCTKNLVDAINEFTVMGAKLLLEWKENSGGLGVSDTINEILKAMNFNKTNIEVENENLIPGLKYVTGPEKGPEKYTPNSSNKMFVADPKKFAAVDTTKVPDYLVLDQEYIVKKRFFGKDMSVAVHSDFSSNKEEIRREAEAGFDGFMKEMGYQSRLEKEKKAKENREIEKEIDKIRIRNEINDKKKKIGEIKGKIIENRKNEEEKNSKKDREDNEKKNTEKKAVPLANKFIRKGDSKLEQYQEKKLIQKNNLGK
ncbi:MAG: hypothetical protein LBB13_03520 [Rickettsiales bacterium]|nr:hypothetical protein [Rickettsiales bacterium]